jgi:hypothetical protein
LLPRLEALGWSITHHSMAPLGLSDAKAIQANRDTPENGWFELRFDIEVDRTPTRLLCFCCNRECYFSGISIMFLTATKLINHHIKSSINYTAKSHTQ